MSDKKPTKVLWINKHLTEKKSIKVLQRKKNVLLMVRQRLILPDVTFDAILFSEGFCFLPLSATCDFCIVILFYHQSIPVDTHDNKLRTPRGYRWESGVIHQWIKDFFCLLKVATSASFQSAVTKSPYNR